MDCSQREITQATIGGYELISGSVIGREHRLSGLPNQDARAWAVDGSYLAAVVCDGCSSGRHSEVGARLSACWLANQGLARLLSGSPLEPDELCSAFTRYIDDVISPLAAGAEQRVGLIHNLFLATFILALSGPEETLLIGFGDGVWAVDRQLEVLEAPHNAPPYPAYRLIDAAWLDGVPQLSPKVLFQGPTDSWSALLLGTDGMSEWLGSKPGLEEGFLLSTVVEHELYWRNPSWLQRQLQRRSSISGGLADDTTLIVIRRREA